MVVLIRLISEEQNCVEALSKDIVDLSNSFVVIIGDGCEGEALGKADEIICISITSIYRPRNLVSTAEENDSVELIAAKLFNTIEVWRVEELEVVFD